MDSSISSSSNRYHDPRRSRRLVAIFKGKSLPGKGLKCSTTQMEFKAISAIELEELLLEGMK